MAARRFVVFRFSQWLLLPVALVISAMIVTFVGGHLMGWRWTGYRQHRDLWDVLHVAVLPVVLAVLPVWLETHTTQGRIWRVTLSASALGFAVVVVGGYAFNWGWTGFRGNTLWDWMTLLFIPATVALLPVWYETHATLRRRWLVGSTLALAALAVVVLGGYAGSWAWTGFSGNTLYDWLDLLMVPLLLPIGVALHTAHARHRREVADRLEKVMRGSAARDPNDAGREREEKPAGALTLPADSRPGPTVRLP